MNLLLHSLLLLFNEKPLFSITDKQGITTQQLEELALKAYEKVFGKPGSTGIKQLL